MAATIRIARGDITKKSGLLGGELFWENTATGELGTLYIGAPDGASAPPLAIGGARAQQSLFFKGTLSGATLPTDAKHGDFWVMSADGTGALAEYKATDWLVCIGTSQFTRVNNSGGLADQITYNNSNSDLGATTVEAALNELDSLKMQFSGTIAANNQIPATPARGGLYLITSSGVVINGVTYVKGDFAYWNSVAWTPIHSGYTDAVDTAFNNTGVLKPLDGGTLVTTVNVQTALKDLYENKADLGPDGKVPTSQLPQYIVGGMHYMGMLDASTAAYPVASSQGEYYVISVAGTISGVDYNAGDWAVYNGATDGWAKIDNTEKISGIFVGPTVQGENPLGGTPRIVGADKVSVTATNNVITVAGQNLVDFATSTPNKVPKVTTAGTIGDSLITDSGTAVTVEGNFVVGSSAAPKTTTLNGGLILEATGLPGSEVTPTVKFGSANGTGSVIVEAPAALAADATIVLPAVSGTLATLQDVQDAKDSAVTGTVGAVPFFSGIHTLSDSKVTQSGAAGSEKITIDAKLDLKKEVNFIDAAGTGKVQFIAPADLAAGTAVQTLPSHDGVLLNSNSEIDGGVFL